MKSPKSPPPSKPAPVVEAPAPRPKAEEDLPEVESLGLAKTAKGWCVVSIKSLGMKVMDQELLHGPESRALAHEHLKLAVVRRLLMPPNAKVKS